MRNIYFVTVFECVDNGKYLERNAKVGGYKTLSAARKRALVRPSVIRDGSLKIVGQTVSADLPHHITTL